MTTAPAPSPTSPAATRALIALLEKRTGQQLAVYRSWRLDIALKPLLRERGLTTLDQLVALIAGGGDTGLADRIVDGLVNSESSFFRDAAVFDLAVDVVGHAESEGRRARIWSAGCSTGQEPLSLAMLLAERTAKATPMTPEIIATDVSETALARARAGRYTQFEVQRGLPIRRLLQWFDQVQEDWTASPELTRTIQYRASNLVADAPPAGRFDLVLCRNVLLYLAPEMKARVFARLAAALRPDGLLILGAGETVIGQTPLFEPSRRYRGLYDRVSEAAAKAA